MGEIERIIQEAQGLLVCIALVVGGLQCFFGYKLFRVMTAIIGFIVGGVIGALLGFAMTRSEGGALAGLLVLGILGALLAYSLYKLGVFVICFGAGAMVGVMLSMMMSNRVEPAFVAICGLILGIVGVVLTKPVIILSTGVGGGMSMGFALSTMFDKASAGMVLGVILSAIGVFLQFYLDKKNVDSGAPDAAGTARQPGLQSKRAPAKPLTRDDFTSQQAIYGAVALGLFGFVLSWCGLLLILGFTGVLYTIFSIAVFAGLGAYQGGRWNSIGRKFFHADEAAIKNRTVAYGAAIGAAAGIVAGMLAGSASKHFAVGVCSFCSCALCGSVMGYMVEMRRRFKEAYGISANDAFKLPAAAPATAEAPAAASAGGAPAAGGAPSPAQPRQPGSPFSFDAATALFKDDLTSRQAIYGAVAWGVLGFGFLGFNLLGIIVNLVLIAIGLLVGGCANREGIEYFTFDGEDFQNARVYIGGGIGILLGLLGATTLHGFGLQAWCVIFWLKVGAAIGYLLEMRRNYRAAHSAAAAAPAAEEAPAAPPSNFYNTAPAAPSAEEPASAPSSAVYAPPAPEPPAVREDALVGSSARLWTPGLPIAVTGTSIFPMEGEPGLVSLALTFQNIGEQPVIGVFLAVKCRNLLNQELEPVEKLTIQDFVLEPGKSRTYTYPRALPDSDTRRIELIVRHVVMADNSTWDCEEGKALTALEEQPSLPFDGQLRWQFFKECNGRTGRHTQIIFKAQPQELEGGWRCACGQLNQGKSCVSCGISRTDLFECADQDYLQRSYDLQQEKEAQQRAEEEERQRAEEEERQRAEEEERQRLEAEKQAEEEKRRLEAEAQEAPPAPRFCANCGQPLEPVARFCPHCGKAVR